jgi:hypothetical protein
MTTTTQRGREEFPQNSKMAGRKEWEFFSKSS